MGDSPGISDSAAGPGNVRVGERATGVATARLCPAIWPPTAGVRLINVDYRAALLMGGDLMLERGQPTLTHGFNGAAHRV